MKNILAVIIAFPIAFIIIINIDKTSHPSGMIGKWGNDTTIYYTFDGNGSGKYDPGKYGDKEESITWFVKDNKLYINQFPHRYSLDLYDDYFVHTGYKEEYSHFTKVASSSDEVQKSPVDAIIDRFTFDKSSNDNQEHGNNIEESSEVSEALEEHPAGDINSEFGIHTENEENYLYVTGNYNKYDGSGKFCFYYPYQLFSGVEKISRYGKYEGEKICGFKFSGSESSLIFAEYHGETEDENAAYYESIVNNLAIETTIVDLKDKDGSCTVYTGYSDDNREEVFYITIRLDSDMVYIMDARFPKSGNDLDQQRKNYYTECLYRGAGFSITKKELRSYDDFLSESGAIDQEFQSSNDIKSITEAETVKW